MTDDQIKHMVNRFLGWKLPDNFNPDAGITFERSYPIHGGQFGIHEPTGTNLFDYTQAEAMVRYMLEGMPAVLSSTDSQSVGDGSIDTTIDGAPRISDVDAAIIWRCIEILTDGEGDTVTVLCPNADFNGLPNYAIVCNGSWTNWKDRRFADDNQVQCFRLARDAMLGMADAAISAMSSREAGLREALYGFDDDYMTSEVHHPGYVLIPTEKFERIRAALNVGGDK